jgi:hypothetical protein
MEPTVRCSELLQILHENRRKHRAVFEAALEGFQKAAEAALSAEIERIRSNSHGRVYVSLDVPKDHTADYDRAVRIVEMHMAGDHGSSIRLSEQDVAEFVMDDWSWKRAWVGTASTYAAATVQEFYDGE